ncbi:MAG: cytochrome c oxidase subunit 2, partial [Natronomonas sp.]
MNVHTYEKIWLVVALALIVGFIGTVTYGAVGAGIEMVDNEGGTIDATAVSEDPRFADPGVERVGENEYEAYVISQQFIFRPSPLEVPA